MAKGRAGKPKPDEVVIIGNQVHAASPEGQHVSMELQEFLRIATDTYGGDVGSRRVLPNGVRVAMRRGKTTIWVYEKPPQVYCLKWIANDSPVPYGKKAKYTTHRISLPYLIVIAVFVSAKHGGLGLSGHNECFFRTSPLKSMNDELCFPALLNCSKFDPPDGRPLSWICTAQMDFDSLNLESDENTRMRLSLRALLHCLLETGYNYSSEHHEESSWFTETVRAGIDPRISGGIRAWEEASAEDCLFVLDVPWLRTGLTLGQVMERIFENTRAMGPKPASAKGIIRILFNHGRIV